MPEIVGVPGRPPRCAGEGLLSGDVLCGDDDAAEGQRREQYEEGVAIVCLLSNVHSRWPGAPGFILRYGVQDPPGACPPAGGIRVGSTAGRRGVPERSITILHDTGHRQTLQDHRTLSEPSALDGSHTLP